MNPRIETADQRSADWFAARLGCATASRFKHVVAKLKSGKPAQARIDYLVEVATERLTGQPTAHFTSAAMQWGTDYEPAARIEYEFARGVEVVETGFVRHPSIAAGASPDGLVGDDGLIEIKCPTSVTHIETLLDGMSDEHLAQVQGQLWITGRSWCDFVSYDPRCPKEIALYVQRVERDDVFIANLDLEVRAFLDEVDDLIKRIRERAGA